MSSAARASSFIAIHSDIERASSTVPPRAVNSAQWSGSRSKKPRRFQRQAEEVPADHFEDRKLRLCLLRYCVHVTEAPFERIVFKNRGGPGGQIRGLGDLTGLLVGMDRGHAQPHALIERDRAVLRGAPDL